LSLENEHVDRKSLRAVTGRAADWDGLARNCVCFANGSGGHILVGIEDGELAPPVGQTVDSGLLDQMRKRIGELSVNVQALPSLVTASNGAQYIDLAVSRATGVASTSTAATSYASATCAIPYSETMSSVSRTSDPLDPGRRRLPE
jgi:ATP-dependent DNA helicase RecG